MEPQEIDSALDELENRLDRLRSLYEQYFMGIEKIEPTVPRKDIDRRFWILRRTQIRNTARRFRLQTLVQRYNTFQQHWTRICREIENGTYVRHLLKAQKNLGAEPKTWAAKKRLGLFRKTADGASPSNRPPSDDTASAAAPGASSPPPPSAPERASQPSIAPRTPSAFPSVRPQNLPPLDLELEDAQALPPPKRSVPPAAIWAPGGGKPPLPVRPGAVPAPPMPRPPMPSRPDAPRPPMPSYADASRPPMPSRPDAPRPPMPSRPDAPRPASKIPLPPARTPAAPSPLPHASPAAAPPTTAAAAKPPATTNAAATGAKLSPAVAPSAPTATAKAAPPATANAPMATSAGTGTAPARPLAPASTGAAAAARADAAKPVVRPAAAAPGPKPGSGLSDERVAQLHAELNAARRQLNQSSSVSIDSLAKSLRETESKLKSQHAGRAVDFQVVIKDGKPIVKPVVRRQG